MLGVDGRYEFPVGHSRVIGNSAHHRCTMVLNWHLNLNALVGGPRPQGFLCSCALERKMLKFDTIWSKGQIQVCLAKVGRLVSPHYAVLCIYISEEESLTLTRSARTWRWSCRSWNWLWVQTARCPRDAAGRRHQPATGGESSADLLFLRSKHIGLFQLFPWAK